ncbi:Kinesin-like protein KIF13A [Varanus komodoensis]|nr:Kinesin-like protein KIF13A [Varanus komodoensis]
MAQRAAFCKCADCGSKMAPTDPHDICLLCLGEGHRTNKCTHCLAFSKQARKNRENRLRRLLWDRALMQSDPLVAVPKPGSASVAPPSRPSDEGASASVAPSASPKKKHEKWKHAESEKSAGHKKVRKEKVSKPPKKPRNSDRPDRPRHWDSGPMGPSVPVALMVLTPPEPVLQEAMRVTPQGSPHRVVDLPPAPLPTLLGSISDGEIQDSPPRTRSPTPMPAVTMEADVGLSPPGSRRSRSVEQCPESWSRPYYHTWGDLLSVGYYPAPRARSSPPSCDQPRSLDPRQASPRSPQGGSSRSFSPEESSSSTPPYYGADSADSEVDSTSPDVAVASQGPASPDESHVSFAELMSRFVQSLDIDTAQRPGPTTDKFYNVVHGEQSTSIVLPLITTLRQVMMQTWDLPSHPQLTSRRYESMYRVREEDIPFLLQHPKLNSAVVESSQGREARGHTALRDKEGRKIDSLARRVYAASGLGLRISNYEATLARFQYFIMQRLHNVASTLPDHQGDLAKVLIKEAMQVAVQQLSTARHHVDTDSRALVSAVSLRRHAWLRNCNLPEETRRRIEEMPFDGSGLFHSRTDHKLEKLHESRLTACRIEIQSHARCKCRLPICESITSDRWVLSIVQHGYRIEFDIVPPSSPIWSTSCSLVLLYEIHQLLRKGAIRQVLPSDGLHGFYSRYFTVPKRDGGLHLILDLRNLNKFIVPKKFRMAALQNILPLLRREDWFASLDLKDTYFHISIHPSYRRFLRFAVANQLYEFTVLPFGLATAPRACTKCMAPVCAFLCLQGIQIYPYLDDWLLVSQSREGLLAAIHTTCALLNSLGLCINTEKSSFLSTQTLTFIGACLDSTLEKGFLPQDRQQTLARHIHRIRREGTVPVRSIQRILGHMASSVAVVPHARLWLCPLQLFFNKVYHPQRDPQINLPKRKRRDWLKDSEKEMLSAEHDLDATSEASSEPDYNYEFAQMEVIMKTLNSNDPVQNVVQVLEKQYLEEKRSALEEQRMMYERELEQLRQQLSPERRYQHCSDRLADAGQTAQQKVKLWSEERDELFRQSLAKLREQIVKANTLVREANFLAEEMSKLTDYQVTLQIPAANLSANKKPKMEKPSQSVKTRPGADCGSGHELLVAKFRLKLKKVGKSTRPLWYDLNYIPDEYTVEVTNRFKELDLIDRVPEDCVDHNKLW